MHRLFARSATNGKGNARAKNIARTASRNTIFASAMTGYTIAPSAGKRASFTWRSRAIAEPMRIEFKIANDARLFAGLRGALEHIASQHGLAKPEQMEFALAAERECQSKLPVASSKDAFCDVTVDSFDDRVEIRITASSAGANGHAAAILIKHFQRNPAHS